MSWTPNCKAGGLNLHCLCVAGFLSSLISTRMQHSDENVARLAQVIFGEKASWWTWGQLERWQAHQVGASRNMNNFAQVVQAYTVQAQAYLYNQTWYLSKKLHNRRFQGKKFTQKTHNFGHLLNCDKKCVNALNWDKTSKKCLVTMWNYSVKCKNHSFSEWITR